MDIKGLKAVTVKKDELLSKIKTNRSAHKADFEDLVAGYRTKLITAIEAGLADAKGGKEMENYLTLPRAPQDHTKDYDRVIAMLEMSVDQQLELPVTEFARYALDEWEWSGDFAATKAAYSNSR